MRKVSRLVAFVLLIPSARRKTQWNLYLTRRNEICTPLNRPDFSPNLSGKRGKAFRFTNAWEQRELGEISEIKTGPFGSSLHASDYVADGVPIITTEHFKFGSIEKNKYLIPMVSDTDHSRLIAYSLKTGDIVFSRVGSVDINALVEPESDGWLFSGRVLRVRSSEKYDSGFLHNLLETDDVRNDIRNRAVGQTMPSINTQILSATELTIPSSKREQQRIGNFFKGINQLLTLHQRQSAGSNLPG